MKGNRQCLDIWDLRDVEKRQRIVKQQDITLLLVTTFLKELPLRRKKKSGLGINKHHDKDIIIPFKSIISDGCEVAAVK